MAVSEGSSGHNTAFSGSTFPMAGPMGAVSGGGAHVMELQQAQQDEDESQPRKRRTRNQNQMEHNKVAQQKYRQVISVTDGPAEVQASDECDRRPSRGTGK